MGASPAPREKCKPRYSEKGNFWGEPQFLGESFSGSSKAKAKQYLQSKGEPLLGGQFDYLSETAIKATSFGKKAKSQKPGANSNYAQAD
jgi:hypothetical protein